MVRLLYVTSTCYTGCAVYARYVLHKKTFIESLRNNVNGLANRRSLSNKRLLSKIHFPFNAIKFVLGQSIDSDIDAAELVKETIWICKRTGRK